LHAHEAELRFMIAIDDIPFNGFLKTLSFDPDRTVGELQKEMANTKFWRGGVAGFFREVKE
jgi:hypothetical protein